MFDELTTILSEVESLSKRAKSAIAKLETAKSGPDTQEAQAAASDTTNIKVTGGDSEGAPITQFSGPEVSGEATSGLPEATEVQTETPPTATDATPAETAPEPTEPTPTPEAEPTTTGA